MKSSLTCSPEKSNFNLKIYMAAPVKCVLPQSSQSDKYHYFLENGDFSTKRKKFWLALTAKFHTFFLLKNYNYAFAFGTLIFDVVNSSNE